MPDVVRPDEKVFVVVDGVAYEVVSGNGSDIGSASDVQVLIGKTADVHPPESKCDVTVSAGSATVSVSSNSCVLVTKPLDKNGPVGSAISPQESDSPLDDSKHTSLTSHSRTMNTSTEASSDSDGIDSAYVPQSGRVNGEPTLPQPRTVLADDDEFEHLTAEFGNNLTPNDFQPSGTKPTTFAKPCLGVAGRLPLQRLQLPKITFQGRPQLRLPTPSAAKSLTTTVGPLTVNVISSSAPTTSPRHSMVTTVIQSSPFVEAASQQPSASPAKSPKKKNASVEKDSTSASAFKRSRQPRISKRIILISLLLALPA